MDVFAMPSYREGFGVVNLEAAAMTLPVVSTRIPGCVDSVADGVTGTLVPPRDADALESAIREYLDNPELRRRHGEAGRQRALRDFRPEGIWEPLYQLYLDLEQERRLR
jgi:glycosyltransferase involved in cell wall biosynthesis